MSSLDEVMNFYWPSKPKADPKGHMLSSEREFLLRSSEVSKYLLQQCADFFEGVRLTYPASVSTRLHDNVWDERLAKSAESWANQCKWDHGPSQLMRHIGQNLSIHSGRYRSIVDLVKAWHDERQHYSFPYPRECTPGCPSKCSGSVCSHYTQMVWASSNRMGCAINTCTNINVWGSTWRQAVFLVCNYSIKGNWIGEAPYKLGRPCSACPPSYGGVCSNNMCFSGVKSNKLSWF
ncbi:peptidase inhibitor R3HDML [Ascaphus truei]|uniref:peptidase inhibitor R3HDML n=1 Tax=Ascaphus truei TaxID=8439 RepID=UPI003F5A5E6A